MSFIWKKAGTFDNENEARKYCDRAGIPFRDQKATTRPDGSVELDVRSETYDADDRPMNSRGRW